MRDDEAKKSLLEHLEELRHRIIVVAIAILMASAIGFALSEPVIVLLQTPLPVAANLVYHSVSEPFTTRLTLALMIGLSLAMPVILYELWAFITPGLTRSERRLVWPLLGVALVLFALGLGLAYLLIPLAVRFLLDFALPGVDPLLGLAGYVSFVTTFMLTFGLALQFPIVLYMLAKLGIFSYAFLSRRRREAILLIVLGAMIITPGDILIGSVALAVVMYGLFELTLQLIRRLGR